MLRFEDEADEAAPHIASVCSNVEAGVLSSTRFKKLVVKK